MNSFSTAPISGSSSSSSAPGPSRQRITGSWQPLPYIQSGFCIYPYQPNSSPPPTPSTATDGQRNHSNRNRFSWSGIRTHAEDQEENRSNAYEVPLDIGDEFFAFEEYRCSINEDGRGDLWYRGYVVQAVSLPSLAPSGSHVHAKTFPRPEPSVLIGIFPAAAVHIRPGASNDTGELTEAYERAVRAAEDNARNANLSWVGEMDTVKEEEEMEGYDVSSPERQKDLERDVIDVTDQNGIKTALKKDGLRTNRPKSLILESRLAELERDKEQPPLPKLTAGDSTIAGQQWPLVDEIACAIREWYGRLPTYLANREYRLFSTVMQHIDALFLGRRQLLSQTLSGDELVRIRRECVSRLVKCNVAQGLEVIVRSLEDGDVMVVDKERASAGASWVGGIACYVYQVQLAYIDLIPLDDLFGKSPSLIDPRPALPSAQPFALINSHASRQSSATSRSHYHCLLDVRAFIANPCAPGETAELYFSLYNKVESRFVTEEFCLILNHLGSPARDAEQRFGRLRTLFVDLKLDDLAHDIYLVCRIVRNGAMKMRQESGTLRPTAGKRTSLYGISEGSPAQNNASTLDHTLTDDSFSVTSGYGGQRAPTIDTFQGSNGYSNSMEGRSLFRRPMGCAVLEIPALSRLLAEGTDKISSGVEFQVPIYLPKDEATFATLHENIIHKRVKEYVTSPRAEAIALSLKVFQGSVDQVIYEHPSVLSNIPLSARLGFPDVVYPGTIRNDLYVKLWSAFFAPVPTSSGGSMRVRKSVISSNHDDVQVTVEVRCGDGQIVPDALIAGGSGEPAMAQYTSLVFHRNDKPTFGELVKISLPSSAQAEGYHLFLIFHSRGKERHITNSDSSDLDQPFAFGYLPLANGITCIQDGDHELILYKSERNVHITPNIYFEVPALAHEEVGAFPTFNKALMPLRDRITLRTYLCSSVQTQDDTLRALLVWHSSGGDVDVLWSTLKLFSFVSEDEIAKFVPSTFDALFSILISDLGDRQDEVEFMIFKSLMKVLAMNSDRRFPNFTSVFGIYLDTQFKHPSSAFSLLKCMKKVMLVPSTIDYRSFLKVWHLFFRIIIKARENDRSRGPGLAEEYSNEVEFKTQTKEILEAINHLMRSNEKHLIGTQTLAVQHYSDILPDLSRIFQPVEISEIVIDFLDTLTLSTGSIAIHKLLLILQVVKNVFESSESRSLLVPAIIRWVKPHLGKFDELRSVGPDDSQVTRDGKRIRWLECNRLAVTVIAWTVNKSQEWLYSPLIKDDDTLRVHEEDNIEYCLTLLPALYESYFDLSKSTTHSALNRQRSSPTSTIWKSTPDVFPSTHPFALISELPPPSLLEQQQNAAQDGLPNSETFNCGLAETAVVILTLILSSPQPNITRWLNEVLDIEGVSSLSETLKLTFNFCRSVISFEAFPKSWLTLSLMSFSSILRFITTLTPILETENFIPKIQIAEAFDSALWSGLFELLCEFLGSDELALEDMSQQRRRAEWIIVGDLRDEGSVLLMRLWNAIGWPADEAIQAEGTELKYGGYQTQFTGLAERILGLCLSSHDAMSETAVEILFSMIYAEYVIAGKFDNIENEIFLKLEKLFAFKSTSSSNDPTMRAYFVAQLRAIFESKPTIDEKFEERVSVFLDEIELFIDLLLSLREVPEDMEWSDEKSQAIHQVMSFVERIGRNDLYIRFIHQLVAIASESKNWLSAGLAIKSHAQIYDWTLDDTLLDDFNMGDIKLPAQTSFQRKESLLYHAIQYFAKAEEYEHALEICQEITTQHQKFTFDVAKLTELLTYQAALWERISTGGRNQPEYFRVAYFGDFGQLNQGKDFVAKGEAWQRYSEFCDALQLKHPEASIHRSKIPPLTSAQESSHPLIWVTPLAPEPDLKKTVFADKVSDNVSSYYRSNRISEFSSFRPYMRDPDEHEIVLTWTEKTILTSKEELPGILNRREITQIRYEQIPPVNMAIMEVEKATKNLRRLSTGKDGHLPQSKLLGTAINGAVDSPVSGGVKTYRRVFLDGTYIEKHPEFASTVNQLRVTILEYVKTIQNTLKIHEVVCKDLAFHEALKTQFFKTFPEEIALLPRPSETSSTSIDDSSQPIKYTIPPNHPLPALPIPIHDSPSISTYSSQSPALSSLYKLPKLKLGSSISSGKGIMTMTNSNSISTHTGTTTSSSPRESINTTRNSQNQTPTPINQQQPIQHNDNLKLLNRSNSLLGNENDFGNMKKQINFEKDQVGIIL